jgi:hypothetical protein
MDTDPLSLDESQSEADGQERMSQNGQIIGIAVYGGLLLVGFFFGIVTGYESPKPVSVAKRDKDKDSTKPPTAPISTPITTPKKDPPQELNPPTDPPKKEEPKVDPPPKKDPPKIENPPKKEEPKVDPPPKKDPPKIDTTPKKEEIPSFVLKDVMPILRKHCTDCHGAGKVQGKVDLTTIDKMKASSGANMGTVLTPGNLKESSLWGSIDSGEMPKDGKTVLTDKEKATIRDWIRGGAKP